MTETISGGPVLAVRLQPRLPFDLSWIFGNSKIRKLVERLTIQLTYEKK